MGWGISDGGRRREVLERLPANVNRCKQANHTTKELAQIDEAVKLVRSTLETDGADPESAVNYSISGNEGTLDVGTGVWVNLAVGAPIAPPPAPVEKGEEKSETTT